MARMQRKAWLKSPYAKSQAQNPDGALYTLLERYGVKSYELGQGEGPGGRRAVRLRVELKGAVYRFLLECLDAEASEEELIRQVKRALFYQLKSVLELASVFFPLEEALFAFRETRDGHTVWEAARPHLAALSAEHFGRLALPAPAGQEGNP
jgi:hypothetical protein